MIFQARKSPIKHNYMDWQDELTQPLRAQMIETVMYTAYHLRLKSETLFKAVGILDAVMTCSRLQKSRIRVVTVTVLHLASKYEETEPPSISQYASVMGFQIMRDQVMQMEQAILNKLGFRLTFPSPTFFTEPLTSFSGKSKDTVYRNMVGYSLELAMLNYPLLQYLPSIIGATACCIAWDFLFPNEVPNFLL